MPMAALTSKLGSALEALLPSTIMAQQPTSTLFFLVLAAVTLGACLGHGLLLRRSSKKDAAAVDGGSKTPRRPLPLRKGYPVIGSTLEVLANLPRFLDWILDSVRDPALGGPDGLGTWGFNVALQPPFVVIHDPECVRHVLTLVDRYGKGPVWRANFWPILGDGIFSADFDNWLTQRKRAANMFKINNFKHAMLEAVRGKLQRFLGILKEKVSEAEEDRAAAVPPSKMEEKGEQAARPSAVVEMQDLFFKLTLDTIGEIAFGRDLGSLSGKNAEFMRAFDFCQQYANDLFFKPGPPWLWGLFTPDGWSNRRHARVLKAYGAKLVEEMVLQAAADENTKEGEEEQQQPSVDTVAAAALGDGDGVARLQQQQQQQQQPHTKRETILSFFLAKESRASLRDPRTLKYLQDVIFNFSIAGRDTVAQAYSWAVHLLALHPEAQSKLRLEARAVLGPLSQAQSGAASYERIQRLEYGYAVVTEVLRLFPSVPKEGKWCYQDDVLPDGTHVRARSWVVFSPFVMGRLEALWADPEAFRPERHLGKPKPSSFIFTAFQGGPRVCLGQNLAYMQLQYGLALLLLAFDIEAVDGNKVAMVQKSPTLPMRDGIRVRLTLRAEEDDEK